MPARADFRLYHSNSLEVLAGLMAEELRAPVPGQPLLAPDVVLIPQASLRRWLQAALAQAHGVAANLEFLTPGEFVSRALDANPDPNAGLFDENFDAAALQWRFYAALNDPASSRDPALRSLRAYLDQGEADPLKPWSLAGELASVFEKYQAWRRDWLLAWEAGEGRLDPQAALWRRIAVGRRHRARRIDDYLARFDPARAGQDVAVPAGLPPRLFAFATLNVSPDVLRVIATQARAGTLHFYLPTPTRKYWGDLNTLAERLRQGEDAAFGRDDNPLLQAWGAAGRDFMAVLGGYEIVHPSGEIAAYDDPETHPDDDPARDSLLQRLQRDLLHRRALPAVPWRAEVDADDPSLQVHACHTQLREVQVLHDRLRGLLEDPRFDPPLQPREIAVLAPDIDPYAPYVEAVFGGIAGRPDFIPYTLADASPLAAEPLAEVFLRLLALPVSRFGLSEILDLLATPAIAEAAGLDAPGLERLRDWLQSAGARWGLDASHRARHAAPRDDAYTWAFALDRLLLGHASGADDFIAGESGAGVAPWPELEGGALAALDALIRLLRILARHEKLFAEAMPPAQWRERLLGLLDALLPERPRELATQRALARLRTLLDEFAAAAAQAEFDAPLPPEAVRAHFRGKLAEADTRAPLLTGGVSFGRMVPMRLLPFRAICVLGMNDGEYPRRDPAAGLNRLTADLNGSSRRRGDRSLRDDDRFLFLQLFAAASEVFYLSYLGADPREGSLREPSVLVAELLDAAAAYHTDPERARERLVLKHPLQPFAPAAFGAARGRDDVSASRRYSYRSEWHPGAAAAHGARAPVGPWSASPLPPPIESEPTLNLADLRAFLRDPPAAFLRQRLALRLPQDIAVAEDVEPLAGPGAGLQRYFLQRAVFDALLRGETDSLQVSLRARAMLPSGPLGRRQLDELIGEVRPYAEAFRQWREGEPQALPFELDIEGVRLQGRIEDLYPRGLARFRFDELHGPAQIAHGLDWLAMSALGDERPLTQFAKFSGGPDARMRPAISAERARAVLRELVTLRRWGLREPLPFLPRAGWIWYEAQQRADSEGLPANGKTPMDRAREQWQSERGWSEGGTASARLALRGRDPFADAEFGERFRHIARQIFDALVHGRGEADA